jgi:hypothetical protein
MWQYIYKLSFIVFLSLKKIKLNELNIKPNNLDCLKKLYLLNSFIFDERCAEHEFRSGCNKSVLYGWVWFNRHFKMVSKSPPFQNILGHLLLNYHF